MKEILETMVTNLVDNKEAVTITEKTSEKTITFEVAVSKEDMGKVIGKQGRIAKAIRIFMKSLGAKEHKRVVIEFVG